MAKTGYDELTSRAQTGDPAAWAELVERYRPRLVILAGRLLGDPDEAQDAVQDALVSAFEKLSQLADPAKFAAWLNVIVLNECRRRRRRPMALALPDLADERDAAQTKTDELGALLAATGQRILDLPSRQSAAATWLYFYGANYAEIAAALDATPAAVASLLQRARAALRGASAEIQAEGERIMDSTNGTFTHIVATPELRAENLDLGDPHWRENRLEMDLSNRSEAPVYLTLDIRSTAPGEVGGWQKGFFYELAPGERRRLSEPYHLRRILSPWYAIFRGPCLSKVRVTLARLSAEQFHPKSGGRPATFLEAPEGILFQKWFDVLVPADPPAEGAPVKPVLPEAGDVAYEGAEVGPMDAGEGELIVALRNHTGEPRAIYVHVDTVGWGDGDEHLLPPDQTSEIHQPYVIYPGSVSKEEPGQIILQVIQLPLNFDELDIGEERFWCRWRYRDEVSQADVIRGEYFPVPTD